MICIVQKAILAPTWHHLGTTWRHLGSVWAPFGCFLALLGILLAPFSPLTPILSHLRRISCHKNASLRPLSCSGVNQQDNAFFCFQSCARMGDEAAEWAQAEEASELLAGWRKEVRAFVRSKRPDQRISGKRWRAHRMPNRSSRGGYHTCSRRLPGNSLPESFLPRAGSSHTSKHPLDGACVCGAALSMTFADYAVT